MGAGRAPGSGGEGRGLTSEELLRAGGACESWESGSWSSSWMGEAGECRVLVTEKAVSNGDREGGRDLTAISQRAAWPSVTVFESFLDHH